MAEKPIVAEKVRHLVRVANTDLAGQKSILYSLRKIKGVSQSFANAVLTVTNIEKTKKTGVLTDAEVKKLTETIQQPKSIPSWLFNRRKDIETGEDKHLLSGDLTFTRDNDIKRMQNMRSYKGLRHAWGLTVRGQRTKSNHRRTKSKNARKGR